MPRLRIYFNGMLGFVPRQSPEGLTVVLPNLKTNIAHPHFHQPALVFYEGDAQEYSGRNDPIPEPYGKLDARLRVWDLNKEHLEIKLCSGDGKDCLPMENKGVDSRRDVSEDVSKPGSWAQARDMRWIPSMGKLIDGDGGIDPDLLKDVDTGKIIARMHLPQGKFRCMEIAREPFWDDNLFEYEFLPRRTLSKMKPQALAEVARIELTCLPQKTFQIASRPLADPTAEPDTVTFHQYNMINCALVNIPKPTWHLGDRLTGHFVHFYDLLPSYTGPRCVPEKIDGSDSTDLSLATLPDIVEVPNENASQDINATVRNENLCPFVQFP